MANDRITGIYERTIDGKVCIIRTAKTGKNRWKAYGDFRGQHISEPGDSESLSISNWVKSAELYANE